LKGQGVVYLLVSERRVYNNEKGIKKFIFEGYIGNVI